MKLITGQRILCALSNLSPGYAKLPLPALRRFYDSYDQLLGSGSRTDVSCEDRADPFGRTADTDQDLSASRGCAYIDHGLFSMAGAM